MEYVSIAGRAAKVITDQVTSLKRTSRWIIGMSPLMWFAVLTVLLMSCATPDPMRGREMFNGKGTCFNCHGKDGNFVQVNPEILKILNPKPTNLRNASSQKFKTDGERFGVIKNGIPGTGMVAHRHLTDEAINDIVAYLRTFEQ